MIAIFMAMFAVTYISRALPLLALSRKRMPSWLRTWLSHVPAAVLGSLAASSILVAGGKLQPPASNVYLMASVPTLIVAARTRNLMLSVVVGMAVVMGLRALGFGLAGAG